MTNDSTLTTIAFLPEPADVSDHLVEIDLPAKDAERVGAGKPTADYVADDQVRRIPIPLARGRIRAEIDQIDKQMSDMDVLGLDEWEDYEP